MPLERGCAICSARKGTWNEEETLSRHPRLRRCRLSPRTYQLVAQHCGPPRKETIDDDSSYPTDPGTSDCFSDLVCIERCRLCAGQGARLYSRRWGGGSE